MSERDGTGTRSRSADAGVAGLIVTKIVLGLTSRLLSFWTEMRASPRVQFAVGPAVVDCEAESCPAAQAPQRREEWVPNVRPARASSRGHLI